MTLAIRWVRSAGPQLRRTPFSLCLLAALIGAAILAACRVFGPHSRLLSLMGLDPAAAPWGHWWAPLTSALWCNRPIGYVLAPLGIVLFAVPAERRIGTVRAATAWALTQVLAACVGTVGLSELSRVPGWWGADPPGPLVVGPGPGVIGLVMAASAVATPLWRRRIRLLGMVGLLTLVLYTGRSGDLIRLLAALVGLGLGRLLHRGAPRARFAPPTRPELRVLLALVVAASAVGPLVASLVYRSAGPLAPLQYLVLAPSPSLDDVHAACADPDLLAQCRSMVVQLRMTGIGPTLLSVLPALLLLLAAEGLRRGRRLALWLAVATNATLCVLAVAMLNVVPRLLDPTWQAPEGSRTADTVVVVIAATQPLLVAALLFAYRRQFPVVTARERYRSLCLLVGGGFVVAVAAYLVGGYLLRHEFSPAPSLGRLVADLPLRFLPVGYLSTLTPAFVPRGPLAVVLYGWTGAGFWLVALTAMGRAILGSQRETPVIDPERARDLLVRYGGDTLSYMATWRGNRHWFSEDGRVALAYRLISSVALTVGGPIGEPASRAAAMSEFTRFCLERGWTPCFYGITEEWAAPLREKGWGVASVAEETLLPLAGLKFTGRRWQDIRTALNRAGRDGIKAEWHRFRDAPQTLTTQVREISEAWVIAKGLPEMGFTLGGLAELADDEVRCLLAIDSDGWVHGLTSWLPVYRDGDVVGWTLDLMRRHPDGFKGVSEFLIASAALSFQQEGAELMSLSGAPLARRGGAEPPRGLDQVLDLLGNTLEPVYGFRSLFSFKAKFQPVYRPLLLAYPDPMALPNIGNAVTRAYLPSLTLGQGLQLTRHVLQGRQARRSASCPAVVPQQRKPEPSRSDDSSQNGAPAG